MTNATTTTNATTNATIIYAEGEATRTDRVEAATAGTHAAAGDHLAAEAALLAAWDAAEFEVPCWPATLVGADGTVWTLDADATRTTGEGEPDLVVYRVTA